MQTTIDGMPVPPEKNPRGNLQVKLERGDWDKIIRLKHRLERETGRIATITDVVRSALASAFARFLADEVPPTPTPAEPTADLGDEKQPPEPAAKKKRHGNKPPVRKSY